MYLIDKLKQHLEREELKGDYKNSLLIRDLKEAIEALSYKFEIEPKK